MVPNRGKRSFGGAVEVKFEAGGAVPYALAAFDLNRDKKLDLIVAYNDLPGVIHWNDGAGGWKPATR